MDKPVMIEEELPLAQTHPDQSVTIRPVAYIRDDEGTDIPHFVPLHFRPEHFPELDRPQVKKQLEQLSLRPKPTVEDVTALPPSQDDETLGHAPSPSPVLQPPRNPTLEQRLQQLLIKDDEFGIRPTIPLPALQTLFQTPEVVVLPEVTPASDELVALTQLGLMSGKKGWQAPRQAVIALYTQHQEEWELRDPVFRTQHKARRKASGRRSTAPPPTFERATELISRTYQRRLKQEDEAVRLKKEGKLDEQLDWKEQVPLFAQVTHIAAQDALAGRPEFQDDVQEKILQVKDLIDPRPFIVPPKPKKPHVSEQDLIDGKATLDPETAQRIQNQRQTALFQDQLKLLRTQAQQLPHQAAKMQEMYVHALNQLHAGVITLEDLHDFLKTKPELMVQPLEQLSHKQVAQVLSTQLEILSRPPVASQQLTPIEEQILQLAVELNERGLFFFNTSYVKGHSATAFHGTFRMTEQGLQLHLCPSCTPLQSLTLQSVVSSPLSLPLQAPAIASVPAGVVGLRSLSSLVAVAELSGAAFGGAMSVGGGGSLGSVVRSTAPRFFDVPKSIKRPALVKNVAPRKPARAPSGGGAVRRASRVFTPAPQRPEISQRPSRKKVVEQAATPPKVKLRQPLRQSPGEAPKPPEKKVISRAEVKKPIVPESIIDKKVKKRSSTPKLTLVYDAKKPAVNSVDRAPLARVTAQPVKRPEVPRTRKVVRLVQRVETPRQAQNSVVRVVPDTPSFSRALLSPKKTEYRPTALPLPKKTEQRPATIPRRFKQVLTTSPRRVERGVQVGSSTRTGSRELRKIQIDRTKTVKRESKVNQVASVRRTEQNSISKSISKTKESTVKEAITTRRTTPTQTETKQTQRTEKVERTQAPAAASLVSETKHRVSIKEERSTQQETQAQHQVQSDRSKEQSEKARVQTDELFLSVPTLAFMALRSLTARGSSVDNMVMTHRHRPADGPPQGRSSAAENIIALRRSSENAQGVGRGGSGSMAVGKKKAVKRDTAVVLPDDTTSTRSTQRTALLSLPMTAVVDPTDSFNLGRQIKMWVREAQMNPAFIQQYYPQHQVKTGRLAA